MSVDRRSVLGGLLGSALCSGGAMADSASIIASHAPGGRFGFILLDANSGTVLDQAQPDDLFIPASLAKIPTTYAAMHVHGAAAQFATKLRMSGRIQNGVLEGDLTLIGGGDPSLDTNDLAALAAQMRDAGLRQITGRFLYYSEALPQSKWLDPQQPWQAPYNPSMGGLNLNYNRIQFKWSRQAGGLSVRGAAVSDGKVAPAPSVKFRIVDTSRALSHEGLDGGEIWNIPQSMLRRDGRRWLPVRRPGLFTASVLHALCGELGVTLPLPQPTTTLMAGTDIAVHRSDSVSDMLRGMLRFSTNLTAEALGAAAGYRTGHRPVDIGHAAQLTTELTQREIGSIGGSEWSGFSLANHSGLSVNSRATPRQIAQTLRAGRARYGQDFVTLFNEKTLGRMPSGAAAPYHQIRSKTGTMHYVRGLAGYLRAGYRDTIFAFMATDDTGRQALDAAFTPYADLAPRDARRWLRRTRTFEGMMIADWLTRYSV